MDLIEILYKEIDKSDKPDIERKIALARTLSSLNSHSSQNVYKIICAYKAKYDPVKRVGETDTSIPYQAESNKETGDVLFVVNLMPDNLILCLEKFIAKN